MVHESTFPIAKPFGLGAATQVYKTMTIEGTDLKEQTQSETTLTERLNK